MNTKTSPKDFFLHLAATVFLYTTVVALIDLAFSVTNRALPDAFPTFYGVGDIVWPISILIVLVPVTYVLEWLINRDITHMPEKKDIWIRRWRIYLTLFLTGVTIVIDLIALINTYLNGEITSRFIYKVLIILVVSAVVFAYYILAKNANPGRQKTWRLSLMWFGVALVVAAIVAGFVIVGSPGNQRAMRFDQERVNDLSNIQYQVVDYWQKTGELPASLQALNNSISSYSVPVDPETRAPYKYNLGDTTSFELCATFDTSSISNNVPGTYVLPGVTNNNWDHGAGYTCFDRTIDTRLYPANPKPAAVPK